MGVDGVVVGEKEGQGMWDQFIVSFEIARVGGGGGIMAQAGNGRGSHACMHESARGLDLGRVDIVTRRGGGSSFSSVRVLRGELCWRTTFTVNAPATIAVVSLGIMMHERMTPGNEFPTRQ